jgi:NAD kinase
MFQFKVGQDESNQSQITVDFQPQKSTTDSIKTETSDEKCRLVNETETKNVFLPIKALF